MATKRKSRRVPWKKERSLAKRRRSGEQPPQTLATHTMPVPGGGQQLTSEDAVGSKGASTRDEPRSQTGALSVCTVKLLLWGQDWGQQRCPSQWLSS